MLRAKHKARRVEVAEIIVRQVLLGEAIVASSSVSSRRWRRRWLYIGRRRIQLKPAYPEGCDETVRMPIAEAHLCHSEVHF